MDNLFQKINEAFKLSQKPETAGKAYDDIYLIYQTGNLPPDYHLTFGWIIYRHLKANFKEIGSVRTRKALATYFSLKVDRPSVLHSSILFIALQVEKTYPEFKFCTFLDMWGISCFRDDDWMIKKTELATYPSTVQKAISLYMKESDETLGFQFPEMFAELVEKAVRRYPDDQELRRQLGKIWFRQGRKDEAMRLYSDMLSDRCKYYLWLDFANMTDDVRLKQAAICKAMLLQKKEEFLGAAHLQLAELLIREKDYGQALTDLQIYYDTYTKNKWKTSQQFWYLKRMVPADATATLRDAEWLRQHAKAADAWIYSGMPSAVMLVHDRFKNKAGKERCKLVSADGISVVVSPALLPQTTQTDEPRFYQMIYQKEGEKVVVKKILAADTAKTIEEYQQKGLITTGKLRLKTNQKGSLYGFVGKCYVGSHLLSGMEDGDVVSVLMREEGERKFAVAAWKNEKK